MLGRSLCSYIDHSPSHSLPHSNPSVATRSCKRRVQLFSIVLGDPLLGSHGGPSQCQVRADCHGGHKSCLCRVLDHPFLAICCCATPAWCQVPSRLGRLSHLGRHSHGCIRGNLSLHLST